jgi:hypothetical protein
MFLCLFWFLESWYWSVGFVLAGSGSVFCVGFCFVVVSWLLFLLRMDSVIWVCGDVLVVH